MTNLVSLAAGSRLNSFCQNRLKVVDLVQIKGLLVPGHGDADGSVGDLYSWLCLLAVLYSNHCQGRVECRLPYFIAPDDCL